MKYGYFFSIVVWFLFLQSSISQTISGELRDSISNRKILSQVNVIFYESSSKEKMEFVSVKNGFFSYTLQNTYDTLIVKATSFSMYQDKILQIIRPQKNKKYHFIIRMQPLKSEQLHEVVIKTDRKIKVKEDTIVFNVKSFSDGTERKLKDLLPKMPGFSVDGNGKIKFQGKTVSVLLIEDDNLFGSDYGTGTKHIKANIVDKIEVISNYQENPLLKDIAFSDQIALNLKLKNKKISFSGDAAIHGGYETPGKILYNFSGTGMQISKKNKSFLVFSSNNVGENDSPVDFYTPYFGPDYYLEFDTRALEFIPEKYSSFLIDENRTRFNKQIFGNLNTIFKAGKNNKVRIKFYGITDQLAFYTEEHSKYFSTAQELTLDEAENAFKKPVQYRGDWQWTSKLSDHSLLQYTGKVITQNINTTSTGFINATEDFTGSLRSKNLYHFHKAEYTLKTNQKTVWQGIVQFTSDQPEQNLYQNSVSNALALSQLTMNHRQVLSAQIIQMKKKELSHQGWIAGYLWHQDFFNVNYSLNSSTAENTEFEYHTLFLKHEKFIKKIKWEIKYHALGGVARINNPFTGQKNHFRYDLFLRIERKFRKFRLYSRLVSKNKFWRDYPWTIQPYFIEIYKQQQYIYPDKLSFNKQISAGINFNSTSLLSGWRFSLTFQEQDGSLIAHTQWNNQPFILSIYKFYPVKETGWGLNISMEKFLSKPKILLHVVYSGRRKTHYFSVLNEGLKKSLSYSHYFKWDISSGYTGFLNFFNKFSYNGNYFPENKSEWVLLSNSTGLLLNFGYYRINLINQTFKPFVGTGDLYHFFDVMFKILPAKKDNFVLEIGINNLLDNRFLVDRQITPYLEYDAYIPVRRRHFLVGLYWDF